MAKLLDSGVSHKATPITRREIVASTWFCKNCIGLYLYKSKEAFEKLAENFFMDHIYPLSN